MGGVHPFFTMSDRPQRPKKEAIQLKEDRPVAKKVLKVVRKVNKVSDVVIILPFTLPTSFSDFSFTILALRFAHSSAAFPDTVIF